ncbi:MAG: NifB/NifX family molybdenum-iron cluster-binding protein [Promethearchaeota archaeon]
MPIIAIPSKEDGGLNDFLNLRFGRCENITFVSIENNDIKKVKVIPIYITEAIGNLGIHLAEIIAQNNASVVIVKYIGHKAFQFLRSHNIRIFQASEEKLTIKQCIDLFIKKKLIEATESNAHLIYE